MSLQRDQRSTSIMIIMIVVMVMMMIIIIEVIVVAVLTRLCFKSVQPSIEAFNGSPVMTTFKA